MDAKSLKNYERLKADFPWQNAVEIKQEIPDINRGNVSQGLDKIADIVNRSGVGNPLILEIGSELGGSARYFNRNIKNLRMICLDMWPKRGLGKGFFTGDQRSPEGDKAISGTKTVGMWSYFAHMTREFEDRIVALQGDRLAGMRKVAEYGIKPDFVYVDCMHTFLPVLQDLELARELFPRAVIFGDDYLNSNHEVMEAVKVFTRRHGLSFDVYKKEYVIGRRFHCTFGERFSSLMFRVDHERRYRKKLRAKSMRRKA